MTKQLENEAPLSSIQKDLESGTSVRSFSKTTPVAEIHELARLRGIIAEMSKKIELLESVFRVDTDTKSLEISTDHIKMDAQSKITLTAPKIKLN